MSNPIDEMIEQFLVLYPNEEHGFAETVLRGNTTDYLIRQCLNESDHLPHDLTTVAFLGFLLSIPEDIRMRYLYEDVGWII